MRRIMLTAVFLAVALCLGGCAPMPLVQTQTEIGEVPLPTPLAALAPVAPQRDAQADRSAQVQLMYISADGQQLIPQMRRLWTAEGAGLLEQVVKTLLQPPPGAELKAVAPSGTRLLWAELVNGIATVNLSSEAGDQGGQDMAYMRVALTNTIANLPDVTYVNILVNGQVVGDGEGFESMPTGAYTLFEGSPQVIWHQMQVDEERFANEEEPGELSVMAVLYFSSERDSHVVPEARSVRVGPDNMIMPLLTELLRGPEELANVRAVFPEGSDPLLTVPTIGPSLDGRRVITLQFRESFEASLREMGLPLDQFYGALTLTLTGFVPDVDGVVVRLGQDRIVDTLMGESGAKTFPSGVMTPSDFRTLVGDVAWIYLSDVDGMLRKAGRVLNPYAKSQPRTLIEQLIEGPADDENELVGVIPEGISSADVLGIEVQEGVALINLSSNFYRCAQNLSSAGERLMVYGIVNTLTEIDGVSRVRFYVEGEVVDYLVHDIYMRTELIRNPGLIAD